MCTAITYKTGDFYFGRNLDLDKSYGEGVTVTPRNYPFVFRNGQVLDKHYAMIGMAMVSDGYPLYFEATNEKGLSLAGLNFPGNAVYYPFAEGKENIAPFELIPWLLGQCANMEEALDRLEKLNIWNMPFSADYPLSPLHWILADKNRAVTIETMKDGMKIHDNPVGVLANNPPFDFHMLNLANYMNLTAQPPVNRFGSVELRPYCLGMGSIGLPGDPSSASRFVRAAFTRLNSVSGPDEAESVGQFFHILGSVAQQKGVSVVCEGEYEYTLYSCCCNADRGVYYYTTYTNSCISAVDMHREKLDGGSVAFYPLRKAQQICFQN